MTTAIMSTVPNVCMVLKQASCRLFGRWDVYCIMIAHMSLIDMNQIDKGLIDKRRGRRDTIHASCRVR